MYTERERERERESYEPVKLLSSKSNKFKLSNSLKLFGIVPHNELCSTWSTCNAVRVPINTGNVPTNWLFSNSKFLNNFKWDKSGISPIHRERERERELM